MTGKQGRELRRAGRDKLLDNPKVTINDLAQSAGILAAGRSGGGCSAPVAPINLKNSGGTRGDAASYQV